MNEPKPGWTAEQAIDMVTQGYAPERIAELSGFAAPFLRAHVAQVGVSGGIST